MIVAHSNSTDPLYEVICPSCSSVLLISKADILSTETNATATLLHTTCPVCAAVVTKTLNKRLSEKVVTPEMYNNLPVQ